jgi:hypothetical protein
MILDWNFGHPLHAALMNRPSYPSMCESRVLLSLIGWEQARQRWRRLGQSEFDIPQNKLDMHQFISFY